MKLYTVILVDDEEEVRQAIIRKLEWEAIGFQVIGYAENGEEALELAERLRPDVVMTDIKMPFMDGLTLCRKLREILRHTKLVIFSGFDEFEYAKEAIKLEVEEYILKPINAAELKNIFERIKLQLDKEVDEKRNMDKLRKYYLDSLPTMREQFLVGLIEGRIAESKVDEFSKAYEISLKSPYYIVGIAHPYSLPDSDITSDNMIPHTELAVLSMKEIINENLRTVCNFKSFIYLESIVVIALLDNKEEAGEFIDIIDQICKSGRRLLGCNISAGVGQICEKLINISDSYEGAKSALDYRVLLEPNQAIYIADIEPQMVNGILEGRYTEKILREIKLGEAKGLKKAIDDLIFYIKNSNLSLTQYHVSLMEMTTEILKLGRTYQLNPDDIFGLEFNSYQDIFQIDSLEVLKQWLVDSTSRIRNSIRRERTDSAKTLTEKARQYIRENYSNSELSVNVLCNHLNVSSTYFSTIFKRETGMSFVMYLTKIRMEQALHLLNTTEDKTYIISDKVGYVEPNYFSYVFKKEFGISPSKYRVNRVENNES